MLEPGSNISNRARTSRTGIKLLELWLELLEPGSNELLEPGSNFSNRARTSRTGLELLEPGLNTRTGLEHLETASNF